MLLIACVVVHPEAHAQSSGVARSSESSNLFSACLQEVTDTGRAPLHKRVLAMLGCYRPRWRPVEDATWTRTQAGSVEE